MSNDSFRLPYGSKCGRLPVIDKYLSSQMISRLLVGGDYRRLVPVSALMGGVVLVLSDIAARMINAPFDTPVGALISILGVPVFFALTFRKEGMVL